MFWRFMYPPEIGSAGSTCAALLKAVKEECCACFPFLISGLGYSCSLLCVTRVDLADIDLMLASSTR